MKVKKLHIESHKHLKDLTLNFTYPEGHEQEGQPLKRVCIIGQSATGKTTILDLLRDNLKKLPDIEIIDNTYLYQHALSFKGTLELFKEDRPIKITRNELYYDNKRIFLPETGIGGTVSGAPFPNLIKLIYLGASSISNSSINIFNQNPTDIINAVTGNNSHNVAVLSRKDFYFYEFSENQDTAIWLSLLGDIIDYRKRFTQLASELINKGDIGNIQKLHNEFLNWSAKNVNPLNSFADSFNPILGKLNLEVDLINTEYPIPIKPRFMDKVIPISELSTGTKGLLLSFFPLHQLDTKDAVILADEPERSLFPDIQVELISHYERLAPEAQLIVATHSPFIAAAFEPYERFILYFDENGNVAVRNGQSPIGDDPNDILKNDFQVNYYNAAGQKAYKDYLALKQKMSQETDLQKKKALLLELNQLGDQYNF